MCGIFSGTDTYNGLPPSSDDLKPELPMVSNVTDPTPLSIYWQVPSESFTVQIDLNPDDETIDCDEFVEKVDLPEGQGTVFDLNERHPIEEGDGNCI